MIKICKKRKLYGKKGKYKEGEKVKGMGNIRTERK